MRMMLAWQNSSFATPMQEEVLTKEAKEMFESLVPGKDGVNLRKSRRSRYFLLQTIRASSMGWSCGRRVLGHLRPADLWVSA